MGIPVFYRPEQSCTEANSFSPSAGKPALVVADWLKRGLITEDDIMSFEPLGVQQISVAHGMTYAYAILDGQLQNGFGNFSKAIADSLRYTTGSMLAAAEYAVLHREHVCSPTSGFHHSSTDNAAGYCTFNGLMIAAISLYRAGLVHKVGILDLDRHYGNGQVEIIERQEIDYVKNHTFGGVFNSREDCEGGKFEAWLKQACDDMQDCDLVICQLGADPHIDDPLGGCLTTEQMRLRDATVFGAFKGKALCWCLAGGYMRDSDGTIEPVLALHRQTMVECLNIYKEDEKKKYTFALSVGCNLAVTFTRQEVQQWPDGREGDQEPIEDVLDRIEQRLTELISREFKLIDRINLYTDGDMLLRIDG